MKQVTRTRFAWFSAGFTVSTALWTNYIWRDHLRLKRNVELEMEDLQARASNLVAASRTNKETSWGSDSQC